MKKHENPSFHGHSMEEMIPHGHTIVRPMPRLPEAKVIDLVHIPFSNREIFDMVNDVFVLEEE